MIRRIPRRQVLACAACAAASWIDAVVAPDWPLTPLSIAAVTLVALWGRTRVVLAASAATALLWWGLRPAGASPVPHAATLAAARLLILLIPALAILRVRWAVQRQQQLADSDPLTGLLNRRAFPRAADPALRRLAEAQRPVTLVFLDIDRFKRLNDTHGHDAGDRLLIAVGHALRNNVRRDDLACRWGGDEFLVLLAGVAFEHAPMVVGRLQTAIRAAVAPERAPGTLSVGCVSSAAAAATLETLIATADRTMYQAKKAGGDTAVYAEA